MIVGLPGDQPLVAVDKIVLNKKTQRQLNIKTFCSLGIVTNNTDENELEHQLSDLGVLLIMTGSKVDAKKIFSLKPEHYTEFLQLGAPSGTDTALDAGGTTGGPGTISRAGTKGFQHKSNNLNMRVLTLRDILCNEKVSLSRDVEHISLGTNKIVAQIPFSAGFNIPSLRPNFLAFFAIPFSTKGANSSFGSAGNASFGKLSSEIIFANNRLNSLSTVFDIIQTDGTISGDIWVGPVHQFSDRSWHAGNRSISGAVTQPLQPREVQNIKISDLRSMETFKALPKMKKLQSEAVRKLENMLNVGRNTQSYISNLNYTVNTRDKVSMSFTFDYLNAIKDMTAYADLYNNITSLLGTCAITSMDITRRRIKTADNFNKLTGGGGPTRNFDYQKRVLRNHPARIRMVGSDQNRGLLHYVMTDHEMGDTTFGLYEYGVEIKILDGTRHILLHSLKKLENLLSKLKIFLKISLVPPNFEGRCCGIESFVGNYSARFISKIRATADSDLIWKSTLLDYVALLNLILPQNSTGPQLAALLAPSVDPVFAGPGGVSLLVRLVEDFCMGVREALKVPSVKAPFSAQDQSMSTSKMSTGNLILTLEENFKTAFDADSLGHYGIEFLSVKKKDIFKNAGQPAAIKTLSYEQWESIIRKESIKTGIPIDQLNKRPYLTPNFIKLPKQIVNTSKSGKNQNKLIKSAIAQILRANSKKQAQTVDLQFNLSESPLINDVSDLNYEDAVKVVNQVDVINHRSAQLSVKDFSETDNLATEPIFPMEQSVDAGQFLQEDNVFITNTDDEFNTYTQEIGVGVSGVNILQEINTYNTNITSYLLEDDFFNGFAEPDSGVTRMKSINTATCFKNTNLNLATYKANLPSRVAAGTSAPQEMNFVDDMEHFRLDPVELPIIAYKYGFIYRVEYFEIRGTPLGSQSRWRSLTFDIFQEAKRSRTSLLCRLHRHQSQLANFNGLRMPIYNELFFIAARVQAVPNPGLTPLPDGTTFSVGSPQQDPNVLRLASSFYSGIRVGSVIKSITPGGGATQGPTVSYPLAGNTSYNANHSHTYTLDEHGSGIANEACHPDLPAICHTHQIIHGSVQSGESRSLSPDGAPPHVHSLAISVNGPVPGPGGSTSASPGTPSGVLATGGGGGGTGGGGGSAGGGGAY